jgi:hypothetical protein
MQESMVQVEIPSEPFKALRGVLRHSKKSGVKLQHEAAEIRADRARD